MLFTTVTALLFPFAIMAIPAGKPASGDDQCQPVSYIMSEYTIAKSSSYYFVSFNVQSSYTVNTQADDQVKAGANCEADGTQIHSSGNLCNIAGQRIDNLTFDLREGSGDATYRIHHKWQCNGATWTSTNDIELPPLNCEAIGDGRNNETVKCTSKAIIFAPQNVRKISSNDEKKVARKTRAEKHTTQPTAKSTNYS